MKVKGISGWACAAYIAALAFLYGCSSEPSGQGDSFDRKKMLTDIATSLIIPGYQRMDEALHELDAAVNAFNMAPSVGTLQAARTAWDTAAFRWQDVVTYDFGPAEGLYGNLSVNVGTFPADASGIEAYVAAGDTSFQNFDRDTRGLFGVEYLLYGSNDDTIIALFSGEGGGSRRAYLQAIVRRMRNDVGTVLSEWNSGYAADFASRNGTDAGSGTSQLFNAMNISYELIKNYKLGLPLGLRAGQTSAEPTKVEAFYSGLSASLIERHFEAVLRVWSGQDLDGNNIDGFEEYLATVPNGVRLIADTKQQIEAVQGASAAVPKSIPLSEQIISMPEPPTTWFTEMQKLTRFLKSELSSLTGIAITYSSGDGD